MATWLDEEEDLRPARIKRIEDRWVQLNGLLKDTVDRGMTLAFYINAGGAVAMLSFMGSDKDIRNFLTAKLALAAFFLGLVSVGVYQVLRYRYVDALFANWRSSVGRYYKNEFDWVEMLNADETLSYNIRPMEIFGYGSFACFLAGGFAGAVGLFWYWP